MCGGAFQSFQKRPCRLCVGLPDYNKRNVLVTYLTGLLVRLMKYIHREKERERVNQ